MSKIKKNKPKKYVTASLQPILISKKNNIEEVKSINTKKKKIPRSSRTTLDGGEELRRHRSQDTEEFHSSKKNFSSVTIGIFLKLSSSHLYRTWNHSISSSYEEDMNFWRKKTKKLRERERWIWWEWERKKGNMIKQDEWEREWRILPIRDLKWIFFYFKK